LSEVQGKGVEIGIEENLGANDYIYKLLSLAAKNSWR